MANKWSSIDDQLHVCFRTQDEEAIGEYFRNKYADSGTVDRFGAGDDMSDDITQQGLLPGVK